MPLTGQSKRRSGDTRADGYRFAQYATRHGKRYELWLCPEAFERKVACTIAHRNRNKVAIAAKMKEYREKFPDRQKATSRRHWIKCREDINKKRAEYVARNKAKVKESLRNWQLKNPAKMAANSKKRKLLKRRQTPSDADFRLIELFYEISQRVAECLGVKHHVDHIFPISKGGLHHQRNLQVLPARINIQKKDKIIPFERAA